MTDRRRSLLLWFGVGAPPLAWAAQLVAGWLVDEAHCGAAGAHWTIDDHLWQAIISVAAITVAVAGTGAAFVVHRALGAAGGDARGRSRFLAVTSLSAGLVFVLLTVITLVGVVALEPCVG